MFSSFVAFTLHPSRWSRLALDRASATLEGLAGLESRILKAEAAFKGKPRNPDSRPGKRIAKLEMQREKIIGILDAASKRLVVIVVFVIVRCFVVQRMLRGDWGLEQKCVACAP